MKSTQSNLQSLFRTHLKRISILVLSFVCGLSVAQARVGESTNECDNRYGNVIFKFQKGDFEYRSYSNKNKTIKCIFKNSVSAWEIIDIGPLKILRDQVGGYMAKEVLPFYSGLLQNAYGFSKEQTDELCLLQRVDEEAMDHTICNDKFKASFEVRAYNFNKNSLCVQIKFRLHVIDTNQTGKALASFAVEGMTTEVNFNQRKSAAGF